MRIRLARKSSNGLHVALTMVVIYLKYYYILVWSKGDRTGSGLLAEWVKNEAKMDRENLQRFAFCPSTSFKRLPTLIQR